MAHFCLQKWGWEPSKYINLTPTERAFVTASIIVRGEDDKKREAELRQKAMRKKK